MDEYRTFKDQEVRGEKLSKHGQMYPAVGEYILTRIVDIYSPKDTEQVHMVVDIPEKENNGTWKFDYPYSWNTDSEESLATVAEEFGYNRKNFHEMVGEPVLIKPNDQNKLKILVVNKAEDRIQSMYEDGEVHVSEIDKQAIEDNFDVNLPFETPEDEEIIFEGDASQVVESVR